MNVATILGGLDISMAPSTWTNMPDNTHGVPTVRACALRFMSCTGKHNLSASPPPDFVSWVRGLRTADVPRPRHRMWGPLSPFHFFYTRTPPSTNTAVQSAPASGRRLAVVTKLTEGASSSVVVRRMGAPPKTFAPTRYNILCRPLQ